MTIRSIADQRRADAAVGTAGDCAKESETKVFWNALGIAAILAQLIVPPASMAFDLTGTWVGRIKCKVFYGGDPYTEVIYPSTLLVQDDRPTGALRLEADGYLDGVPFFAMTKIPNSDDPDRGYVYFSSCPFATPGGVAQEAGIFKVATNPSTGSGRLVATSSGSIAAFETYFMYTCRWTHERTNTANPGLAPTCPEF